MTEVVAPGGAVAEPAAAGAPHVPLVSAGFRRYALIILLLVYTVNFLDRQIVTVLAEPIKNELGISDTQLGLLTGFAFGIIYVGLGLPLARLADRFNRVWIIAGSMAVWSVFTIACGRATSFATLVAARMGVAVGEAGCTPTAHALISDYTPREKRASALAFFSLGTPIGAVLGLALGGVLADSYGWRSAFVLAGLPGLLLTVIVFLTLREPRNAMTQASRQEAQAAQLSFTDTVKYLAGKPTFWLVAFAASIKAFVGYGHAPFMIAFLLRVHGDQLAALAAPFGLKPLGFLGIVLGPVAGVLAGLSTWVGGAIADRYGAKDLRAYMSVPAIAALVSIPCFVAAALVDNVVLTFLFLLPRYLVTSLWYGPVYASAQGLVPPQMRATAASIMLFIINMIGLGFGALAVGALSDAFNVGLGLGKADGVRWALISSEMLGLVAAVLFWLARRRIREEMVS